MRRWRTRLLLALAASAIASCSIERGDGLGSPCEDDTDCPDGFFCGADGEAPATEARICVPEASCDPDTFGVACAGAGLYSCLEDEVIWTSCEPGDCRNGACRD